MCRYLLLTLTLLVVLIGCDSSSMEEPSPAGIYEGRVLDTANDIPFDIMLTLYPEGGAIAGTGTLSASPILTFDVNITGDYNAPDVEFTLTTPPGDQQVGPFVFDGVVRDDGRILEGDFIGGGFNQSVTLVRR